MSRIGNKLINVPKEVEVMVYGNKILVKGPKGELWLNFHGKISLIQKENTIIVKPKSNDKLAHSLHGLTRSLIANMITGVTQGYSKKLEIVGVGYRVLLQGDNLVLSVGFSHPVIIKAPEGINFSIQKNSITILGIDKQKVGEIAAKIRKVRKPEPYKGKGIRYFGEEVKRKAGKAAKTATSGGE